MEDYLRKHNDAVVPNYRKNENNQKDIKSLNRHLKDAELERNGYLVDTAPYILLKDEIELHIVLFNKRSKKETFHHE